MKEGNLKQLGVSAMVLGAISAFWYYTRNTEAVGYVSAGLFIGVIGFLLYKMFKK